MIRKLLNTYLLLITLQALYLYSACQTNGQAIRVSSTVDCKENCPEIIAAIKQNEQWGFIDTTGRLVITPRFLTMEEEEYSSLQFYEGIGMVRAASTQKAGAINHKGEWLLAPEYSYLYNAYQGTIIGENFDQQEIRWNTALEKETLPSGYKEIGIFDEAGYAYARTGQLYTCINRMGKTLIPFQSYRRIVFIEDFASIDVGNELDNRGDRISQYTFINRKGELLLEPVYDFTFFFVNGHAIMTKDGKDGIIDTTGKVWVDFNFHIPISTYKGFQYGVEFAKNGENHASEADKGFGLIDREGQWIVKPSFDDVEAFADHVAPVMLDDKWGLIDHSGHWLLKPSLEMIECFSEGLGLAQKEGLYGYLDTKGNWAIPPQFEAATAFQMGFASVLQDGKWGFINRKGELVIDYQYESVGTFHNIYQKQLPGIQD